jgi:hypothetical protein
MKKISLNFHLVKYFVFSVVIDVLKTIIKLMGETFTKNLFAITNNTVVKDKNATENLGADDVIFFNSLRPDLSKLELRPKLQTIHQILDYSKSLR